MRLVIFIALLCCVHYAKGYTNHILDYMNEKTPNLNIQKYFKREAFSSNDDILDGILGGSRSNFEQSARFKAVSSRLGNGTTPYEIAKAFSSNYIEDYDLSASVQSNTNTRNVPTYECTVNGQTDVVIPSGSVRLIGNNIRKKQTCHFKITALNGNRLDWICRKYKCRGKHGTCNKLLDVSYQNRVADNPLDLSFGTRNYVMAFDCDVESYYINVLPPLTDCSCYCGMPMPSHRIVGGTDADTGEYPYQSFLVINGDDDFYCGAVLVSDTYIMTAAHCVDFLDFFGYTIDAILGITNRENIANGRREPVREITIHPQYNGDILEYDFAILRIDTIDFSNSDADMIRPACFAPTVRDYVGETVTPIGWGLTSTGGSASNILQEVDEVVVTNAECGAAYEFHFDDSIMCANAATNGKGTCNGDSGGALLSANGGGLGTFYDLVGLVSFGSIFGCALADFPDGFARISDQLDWIFTQISDSFTCARPV